MNVPTQTYRLGEYQLKQLLGEGPMSRVWLAEQESIRRTVLVEELRPERAADADRFIANVRAKAAVVHPVIGTVYEAVAGQDACYYARELLPGATLADRLRAGARLKPLRVAQCLRRVAEVNLYHETEGHATEAFEPDDVHLDESGVVRVENLAVVGVRAPEQSRRDVVNFGTKLRPLVADGLPGATRVMTLLSWMRGEGLAEPLTWKAVQGYCEQIEQQLLDMAPAVVPIGRAAARPPVNSVVGPVMIGVGLLVLLIVVAGVLLSRPGKRPARNKPAPVVPEAVHPAGGDAAGANGKG